MTRQTLKKQDSIILSEETNAFFSEINEELLKRGKKTFNPGLIVDFYFERYKKQKENIKKQLLEKHSPLGYKLKNAALSDKKLKAVSKILDMDESILASELAKL